METPAHEVGRFVRTRRRKNKMSQAGLALLAGVGRRFVSELERGKSSVRLEQVERVLNVFGKRIGIVDRERLDG